MRDLARAAVAVLVAASLATALTTEGRARLEEAVRALKAEDAASRRTEIAASFETLAADTSLAAELREQLRQAAGELKQTPKTSGFSATPYLELLERVRVSAGAAELGLTFQGSYTQTKVTEPAYGGHASAMGPPPVASPTAAVASPVQFVEKPGLETKTYCGGSTKDHILESGGTGVALFDYDADGKLDVYLVNAPSLTEERQRVPHRSALYRNLGGWKFQDVSAASGLDAASWGNGACAGDYDDDGKLDLYVTNWGDNFLFRNQGDGTFKDVAARAGVTSGGWSTGCAFLDADNDGDLDLYVARYVQTSWDELVKAERTLKWRGVAPVMIGPIGLPGEADRFFENKGDGTFTEASEAFGLTDSAKAYGFGVVATDYDDDGRADLFVANDTNPNFLFRNLGSRKFESVGLLSGVALSGDGRAQAGMGVDSGDVDGDGRLDLYVTNFAHDNDALYRNLDGGQFEDVSRAAGIDAPSFVRMGWGVVFFDADHDGDLDLFTANGHIHPNVDDFPDLAETFAQRNQLFLNDGGRFSDVSATAGSGLAVRKVSRGLAAGDLDGDGDMDLLVSNMDDMPTLLENRLEPRSWIAFRIDRPGRNRFGIGAKVTIEAGGRKQIREIRSGGSYLSQSELIARFGLGDHQGAVDVEVRLPGGGQWRFRGLAAGQLHALVLDDSKRLD